MNTSKTKQTLQNRKKENEERDADQTLVKQFEAHNLADEADDIAEEQRSRMPWRTFGRNGDWTPEYRTYLKTQVKNSEVKQAMTSARFLFIGPVASGKSSFINSVASVDKDRIAAPLAAGSTDASLSFKFKLYSPTKHLTNFTLCDTMGFSEDGDFTIRDLNYLLDGNVKPDYKLDQQTPIDVYKRRDFKNTPSLMEKIHCAAIVFDSERIYFDYLSTQEKSKIKTIQETIRIKAEKYISGEELHRRNRH